METQTWSLFEEMKEQLYLIDAHSHIYRAFYGIPELKNSKGQTTNAVYGFTNMLLKLLKEEKPDYIACVFDNPAPTWRECEFPDYKIHREKMPDDLKAQLPIIKDVLDGFNIPIFEMPGFEADDILGTIVQLAAKERLQIIIASHDKDILQLVNDNTKVLNDRKEKLYYDRNAVIEKMGVQPENIPDFLALCGDSSDNIPGVSGIGQKGALNLITQFGTIENLIENVNEIKNEKHKRSILENKDCAILSKRLATIKIDVPLSFDIDACKAKEFNREKLTELFKELEFRGLL